VRQRALSEPHGVLLAEDRDVPDPGQRVYPCLRILCGPTGRPSPPDPEEPQRVAEAARRLALRHVVITSVTRDDLPDGGAEHFHQCVLAVRQTTEATVEVLTPDFGNSPLAVERVVAAGPQIVNHNTETVPDSTDACAAPKRIIDELSACFLA